MGDKATQSDSEKDNGKSHTPALQGGQEINAGPIGERRPDLIPRAQRGQILPGEILLLQRAIGNQAVGRLMRRAAQSQRAEPQEPLSHQTATIQPKLTVEAPDGPYEQEADHVAQQEFERRNGADETPDSDNADRAALVIRLIGEF
jgi:hypothetical protein